jgi:hypothetical protein
MDTKLSPLAQEGLLPNREQSLVLAAALGDDADARAAYAEWRSTLDISAHFDHQVFRLLPLMYDRLRKLGIQDDLTGRLKGTYRQAWARNHRLLDEMRPVLAALSTAGVRTLVLKGAPLALAYYRNVALRPMDDVDLAVRRADVQHTLQVLQQFGYQPRFPLEEASMRYRHSAAVFTAQGKQIDLHWDVIPECPGAAGERLFWAEAEPLDFLGEQTETLAPTQMLLHTVVHGMRWNREPPVRWIPDAAVLLRQRGAEVDWNALLRHAREFRLSYRLALGLRHLQQTVAPEVPDSLLRELEADRLDWLQRLERQTILRDFYKVYRTPFGPVKQALASAGRRLHGQPPWLAAWQLIDFLRFRWGKGHWGRFFKQVAWGLYTRTLRNPARHFQDRWARGR